MTSFFPTPTVELALDDNPTGPYAEMTLCLNPLVYIRNVPAVQPGDLVYDWTPNGWTATAGGPGGFGGDTAGPFPGDPEVTASFPAGFTLRASGTLGGHGFTAGQFSLELWIQPVTSTGGNGIGRGKSGGLTTGWSFLGANANTITFTAGSTSGYIPAFVPSPFLNDGRWHHVVFVADTGKFYLDGALAYDAASPAPATTGSAFDYFAFGEGGSSAAAHMAAYDYNLSAAQILAHYQAASVAVPLRWTDVSSYYIGGGLTRGRQQELDSIEAGSGDCRLDNTTRVFDPTNAAGPYYGRLLPMRRLRTRWTGPTQPYSNVVRSKLLSQYYRLGDSGGTLVVDSSPSGMNGTLLGSPTFGVAGPIVGDTDTAVTFSAARGDAIRSTVAQPLNAMSWAIECWFKRTTPGRLDPLVFIGSDPIPGAGLCLLVDTDNKVKFSTKNDITGAPTGIVVASSSAYADTNWHHVVFNAGSGRLFVDGVLAGTTNNNFCGTAAVGYRLMLGAVWFGSLPRAFLDGSLDEVAIYRVPLSDEEIVFNYGAATALSGTYTRALGLIERYPQVWEFPVESRAELTIVDGFEQLALSDISGQSWSAELAGARVHHVLDACFWPRSLRRIDAGAATIAATAFTAGSFSAGLTHLQDVADTDLGAFFISGDGYATFHDRNHRATSYSSVTAQATFGDTDANANALPVEDAVPDYSRDHIYNQVTTTRSGGTAQTAQDGASIGRFFARTLSRSTLNTTDADSLAQSQALVAAHKDPALRFEEIAFTPSALNDTALATRLWTQILSRDFGDRIAVALSPPGGGSPITLEGYIERVKDAYTGDLRWETGWQLSPAAVAVVAVAAAADTGARARFPQLIQQPRFPVQIPTILTK